MRIRMRTACLAMIGLASFALSACGKKDAKPPPAAAKAPAATPAPAAEKPAKKTPASPKSDISGEVVVWHAYRGAEQEAIEKLLLAFDAQHPKLEVRVLPVPFDAYVDKITVTIPRGSGPDVLIFPGHNMIGEWVRRGLIAPMGKHFGGEKLGRFLKFCVKALVHDGSLYGAPLAFKSLALFYDPAKVKEPPKTVSELEALAKKHTDLSNSESPSYGFLYQPDLLYQHAPWLHAFGGVAMDGAAPALNTPAFLESVRFVSRLAGKGKLIPPAMSGFLIGSLFNKGRVAMVVKGPWFLGEIEEGVGYAVAPLPEVAGKGPLQPYLGVEAAMLSAKAKNVPAAVAAIDHLTSDASARTRLLEGRQPVANAATYDDAGVKKSEVFKVIGVFREQAERAVIMPKVPEMQPIWATADMALQKSFYGGADPAKALADAQAKAVRDIASMGR